MGFPIPVTSSVSLVLCSVKLSYGHQVRYISPVKADHILAPSMAWSGYEFWLFHGLGFDYKLSRSGVPYYCNGRMLEVRTVLYGGHGLRLTF